MPNWLDKSWDAVGRGYEWATRAATERIPNSLNLHARGSLGVAAALGSAAMGGAALYGTREAFNAGIRMDPLRSQLNERGELNMDLGRGRFSSNAYWGRSMGKPWDHSRGLIGRAMKEPYLTDGQIGKELELSPLQRAGYTALSAATSPITVGIGVGAAGLFAARRAYKKSVMDTKEIDLGEAQAKYAKDAKGLEARNRLEASRTARSAEKLRALGVDLADDFSSSAKSWEGAERSIENSVKSQQDPGIKKALEEERNRLYKARQKSEAASRQADLVKSQQEALPDHVAKYNQQLQEAKARYSPKPKPPSPPSTPDGPFESNLKKEAEAAVKAPKPTVRQRFDSWMGNAIKKALPTDAEKATMEANRKASNVAQFSEREKASIEARERQRAIGQMREHLYDQKGRTDAKTWTPAQERAKAAAEASRTEESWKRHTPHERESAARWARKEGQKQGWTKTKEDQMLQERLSNREKEFLKKTADPALAAQVEKTAKEMTQKTLEGGKGLIRRGVEGVGKSLRAGHTAALFGGAAVAVGAVASIGAGIGALVPMLEDESVDHALSLARLNPNTNMQGADYSGGQVQGRPRDVEEVMSFSGRGPRGLSGMNLGASGDLALALHHLRKG